MGTLGLITTVHIGKKLLKNSLVKGFCEKPNAPLLTKTRKDLKKHGLYD